MAWGIVLGQVRLDEGVQRPDFRAGADKRGLLHSVVADKHDVDTIYRGIVGNEFDPDNEVAVMVVVVDDVVVDVVVELLGVHLLLNVDDMANDFAVVVYESAKEGPVEKDDHVEGQLVVVGDVAMEGIHY